MLYITYFWFTVIYVYIHNDFIPEFSCHNNHDNEIIYNVTFTGIQLSFVYATTYIYYVRRALTCQKDRLKQEII